MTASNLSWPDVLGDSSAFTRPAPGSKLRWVLAALMLLSIARLWLMPLGSGFWVDEMGTMFVVRHGAEEPSLRAVPQVPASIYYALPRLAERVFGDSEVASRLPSMLAMAAALYLIARIAGVLIHPAAGWFAAFGCLALHGFNYQAADARPYALGTLVTAAAMWFLIRWLDRGLWRDGVVFAIAAAMLWRVHLVFWPIYAALVFYAVVRLWRADTAVGWTRAGVVFGVSGLSLVPVLAGALALYRNAGAHVVVPPPTAMDLINALKLGLLAAVCSGVALLSRRLNWPRIACGPSTSDYCLMFGWWLSQPLCLFAFSWATGNSVFVSRYLYVALPGTALIATAAAAAFVPPARWGTVSAVLGCGVLLAMGGWSHLWPPHHNSGWRAAALQLNELSLGRNLPVICPSPFIEAKPPVWRPDYPTSGFLYSYLEVYPVRGKVYPFPFEASPEAEQFAAALSRDTLAVSDHFAVYGGDRNVLWWRDWFAARPELAGWQSRRLGPFGDVDVVVFEKVGQSPSSPQQRLPVQPARRRPRIGNLARVVEIVSRGGAERPLATPVAKCPVAEGCYRAAMRLSVA